LVFRAYGCDSKLLGGTPSWAPTAATMAAYMERTGKVISYKGIDSSELLPGDLIFYRMKRGSNGRYRNIYHVSMYYGDGYRLEKPLRRYAKESHITMIARPTK
jgi:cell wall-associated NlpC family hydrolase